MSSAPPLTNYRPVSYHVNEEQKGKHASIPQLLAQADSKISHMTSYVMGSFFEEEDGALM